MIYWGQTHGITSHKTLISIAFPYLYIPCTRDICKISTFSNFQMFGRIKRSYLPVSFYRYTVWRHNVGRTKRSCSSHIMTSYCVYITEQTTVKSYLFVNLAIQGEPGNVAWVTFKNFCFSFLSYHYSIKCITFTYTRHFYLQKTFKI
jgi:hypothetical protein